MAIRRDRECPNLEVMTKTMSRHYAAQVQAIVGSSFGNCICEILRLEKPLETPNRGVNASYDRTAGLTGTTSSTISS
jgi:hypothetical protein